MPWGWCIDLVNEAPPPKVGRPDRGDRAAVKASRKANRKRR